MIWEAKKLDDTYSAVYKDGELVRVNIETTDAEFFVDELKDRDRIITELLAMLKPQEGDDEVETSEGLLHYNIAARVYQRACEIAGRTE